MPKLEDTNIFSELSDEVILKIFNFLDFSDLLNVSNVNNRFNIIAKDKSIWERQLTLFKFDQTNNGEDLKPIFMKKTRSILKEQNSYDVMLLSSNVDKKLQFCEFLQFVSMSAEYSIFKDKGNIPLNIWDTLGSEKKLASNLIDNTNFLLYYPDNADEFLSFKSQVDKNVLTERMKNINPKRKEIIKSWCLINPDSKEKEAIEQIAQQNNIEIIYVPEIKNSQAEEKNYQIIKDCLTEVTQFIHTKKQELIHNDNNANDNARESRNCNVI